MSTPKVHAEEVMATVATSQTGLAASLETSWRRSAVLHGLDPGAPRRPERVTDSEFRAACDQMAEVHLHAEAALDRLFTLVGRGGCCVVLTDPDGVIIEHRVSPEDETTFRAWNLWRKGVWSEAHEGTNGIGTCLAEQRAVSIKRDQHFAERNVGLSCIDAPIWGPDGELVGAVDVSTARKDAQGAELRLIEAVVNETAAQIETELFRTRYASARIMMGPTVAPGRVSLLATDQDDLLIGASRAARKALSLRDADFGRPLLSRGQESRGLSGAERSEIIRALAANRGNASAAARDLGIGRATLYRRMERLGIKRESDLSQD